MIFHFNLVGQKPGSGGNGRAAFLQGREPASRILEEIALPVSGRNGREQQKSLDGEGVIRRVSKQLANDSLGLGNGEVALRGRE